MGELPATPEAGSGFPAAAPTTKSSRTASDRVLLVRDRATGRRFDNCRDVHRDGRAAARPSRTSGPFAAREADRSRGSSDPAAAGPDNYRGRAVAGLRPWALSEKGDRLSSRPGVSLGALSS